MSTIAITTTQNIDVEYDLASLGERIVAHIIDLFLLILYVLLASAIFSFTNPGKDATWIIYLVFMIPLFFYHLLCEIFFNGQSLGKKIMGIKVISLDGEQPTFSQYLIRWLFRLVDFAFSSWLCGLIMVAVTEKRQRLGDMIAGTSLVKTRPRTSITQTLFVPVSETVYEATYPEVINLSDQDMQLVKEILISVRRSGNTMLALQTMNKIEQVLGITSRQEPIDFLYTVLTDYNKLASRL